MKKVFFSIFVCILVIVLAFNLYPKKVIAPIISIDDYNKIVTEQVYPNNLNQYFVTEISTTDILNSTNKISKETFTFNDNNISEFKFEKEDYSNIILFDFKNNRRVSNISDYGLISSSIDNTIKYGVLVYSKNIYHTIDSDTIVYTFSITYYYDYKKNILTILVTPFDLGKYEIQGDSYLRIMNGITVAKIVKDKDVYKFFNFEKGKLIEVQSLKYKNIKASSINIVFEQNIIFE